MRTVYKYEIDVDDAVHTVPLPNGATVVATAPLSIDKINVWCLVETANGNVNHSLRAFGTGQSVPTGAMHVGTVINALGLVWHLFEMVDTASKPTGLGVTTQINLNTLLGIRIGL